MFKKGDWVFIDGQKFILDESYVAKPIKIKINKTFECWVNAYPKNAGWNNVYYTESEADAGSPMPSTRLNHGKAFHFVGQYTVEE